MKTRERLLFMMLGGLLVWVGMILGQFVFSSAQADVAGQEPGDIIHHGHGYFKSITCESLEVVEPAKGRTAISLYHTNKGNGAINVYNTKIPVRDRSQPPAVSLKAGDDNSGSLAILNKYGKNDSSVIQIEICG